MSSPDESAQTRPALAVVSALWAALFGPFLVAGGLPVFRDQLLSYLPLRHFWAEQVRAGRLPSWFPWEGLGEPFIGQGIGATFSPTNVLYLLFDDPLALRSEIALTLLAGALGQVLLSRRFTLSAPAAVTSAAALVVSGYALSMTSNMAYLRGLCLLPWVALFAHAVLTAQRPWAATAGLALAWALIPLGGDAAGTLLAAAVVAAVAFGVGASWRLPWLGVAALLAALLASPELLPAGAVRANSVITDFHNAEFLSSFWALHPARLPELLLPGLTPAAEFWVRTPLGESGRWAESLFIGAAVLLFATSIPRARLEVSFVLLSALGLWLALGVHGGLELGLRKLVPMLNTIRNPEKHFALATFGLAVATGFGFDRVVKTPRALVRGALITLGLVLLSRVASDAQAANGALLLALGLLGLTVAMCLLAHHDARAAWLLPMVVAGSLWSEPLGLMTISPAEFALQPLPPGEGRVWRESGSPFLPTDADSLRAWALSEHSLLDGALGGLHHRATFGGSTTLPLAPRRERALLSWNLTSTRSLAPLYGYGVSLLADGTPLLLPAAPRAWVASPEGVPDVATLLARLRQSPEAARLHPLVLGSVPEGGHDPGGTVRWVRDEVNELELAATLEHDGLLVLNDFAADGWTATVDGAPAPVAIVNALVRGVWLPAGEHRVVFRYEVPRLKAGLWLFALAAGVLIALLALEVRRARAQTPARS